MLEEVAFYIETGWEQAVVDSTRGLDIESVGIAVWGEGLAKNSRAVQSRQEEAVHTQEWQAVPRAMAKCLE